MPSVAPTIMRHSIVAGFLVIGLGSPTVARADSPGVFVEAEQFDRYGGWVDDSQFIDRMGSSFLLAHGLGRPVEDATTRIDVPEGGAYRVWVRTRDWTAAWNAPESPGRFQVLLDGQAMETTFGTEGAAWHWRKGDVVELAPGEATLALHDLTGFDGRCDAVLFAPLAWGDDFTPPDHGDSLAEFRREMTGIDAEPIDGGEYDLVVVGGGIAGTCAAVSAARCGLSVALIQDRPVLGGNNSSEVRVWLQGARNIAPFVHIGDIVGELEQAKSAHYGPDNTAEIYEDDKKIALVEAEDGITLALMHRAIDVVRRGDDIESVVAVRTRTGERVRFRGRWFADCTGDGCLGHLAGADYDMAENGRMGRCNLWNVVDTGEPVAFPRCPWAIDLSEKPFPGRADLDPLQLGGWYWESGFDHDPFEKSEYIRDWNFRAAYGAWDALKNVDHAFPTYKLNWMAHIAGKRESRRLLGDVILTKEDLTGGRAFPDGCVPTGWKIDVHKPNPEYEWGFEGDAFISRAEFTDYAQPFWVPYRCLYSRNIDNLFMAGRDISVTHDALGATRVMRTGGCMGEVVGLASLVCKRNDATPRDVYAYYLEELMSLMRRPPYAKDWMPVPDELARTVGRNIAIDATITASSRKSAAYDAAFVADGAADLSRNEGRWVSEAEAPDWIVFEWEKPKRIVGLRVLSGYRDGGVIEPIRDFQLQREIDGLWTGIPGATVRANKTHDCAITFEPVAAERVRLNVTLTKDDIARVWEVQIFEEKRWWGLERVTDGPQFEQVRDFDRRPGGGRGPGPMFGPGPGRGMGPGPGMGMGYGPRWRGGRGPVAPWSGSRVLAP